MVGLLFLFSPQASADDRPTPPLDDAVDPNPDEEEGPPVNTPPVRDFAKLYPAGEGKDAQSYDELEQFDKDYVDGAALWAETDHGHAVHNRWSGVFRRKRAEAKAKRAAQLSGTQGLDTLGVQ